MFEKTKGFCNHFLEIGVPGFDLAIYKNGDCILRHINGYSDLENKIKMNGNERYNIYSCSKVITCVAALQLWERGLFSLEDRLSDFMPEFTDMTVKTHDGIKKAENPILIKHLFEMTAGFSYNTYSPELLKCRKETGGACPIREVMRYLAKEPLSAEPGDRWEYSLCHDVLAALVEVISGEGFEDYVQKNIFSPLGMKNSTFMLADNELDSISSQYRYIDGKAVNIGKQIFEYKLGSDYVSGGAGAISTVDDYIKFSEALRTYKLFKPETAALMATDRLSDHQKRSFWFRQSHGYGLGVRCPNGNDIYTDFGWGGAAGAFLAIDIENELSLYFGSHIIQSPAQGLRLLIYRIVRAELFDIADLENIQELVKKLDNYNLIY